MWYNYFFRNQNPVQLTEKTYPDAKNQRLGKRFTDAPGSDIEPGVFGS
jgi:hypothetical protein